MFARILPNVFTHVFGKGDEKTRLSLYKLRNTWTPLFNSEVLHEVDIKTKKIDKAWPVQASNGAQHPPEVAPKKTGSGGSSTIHVNPNFIGRQASVDEKKDDDISKMEKELKALKKKKLEIELEKLKKELDEVN